MKSRPGDRKRRWQSTCITQGIIMTFIASLIICSGCIPLGLFILFFAMWSFLDAKRGWRISYKIPQRALDMAKRHDISGEVARNAIRKTREAAKNPNRKRYAFEKGD